MAEPLTASMPSSLDLQDGYTLRITALDPTTGALVAGVNIQTVVLTASNYGGGGGGGGGTSGDWFLVPGPGA